MIGRPCHGQKNVEGSGRSLMLGIGGIGKNHKELKNE
jgi:hypothetical protein